jgi:mono/diheme cytochrome c family protein
VRRLARLIAVGAAVLVAAGCGSVGYTDASGDRAKGKELFTQKCGSCHTLADAGSLGKVGPNLDDAFARARADGMTEATFRQVVRGQIAYAVTNPVTGSPGMPKDIVKGDDARDVAAYVASVAGK